ncbi:MAG: hypothetical protein HYX28_00100 [Candidatus Koribacter versatilis]|uniref:Uncharacterized protein n=1 Tax=Candidatus Korobacter versatilis TaxID=658062 RepID=A0A932A5Q3_9BACT|nr:hypothetical protein [Candidatus Koribacter versatilis]
MSLKNITAVGALFAAALIFFVVVCPQTPTPIAVVGAHGKAPAPSLAFFAVLLLPFTLRVERSFAYASLTESCHEMPSPDLLDLTCARLC